MKKILIFDACRSIRQRLSEDLAAEGHVAMSIGKAEFVLESVERFDPDLIVLDLYVRGEILWDLLDELKARYPAIPLLLFMAFHPLEMPRFKKADSWLEKDLLLEDLKENIVILAEQRKKAFVLREPILAPYPAGMTGVFGPPACPSGQHTGFLQGEREIPLERERGNETGVPG